MALHAEYAHGKKSALEDEFGPGLLSGCSLGEPNGKAGDPHWLNRAWQPCNAESVRPTEYEDYINLPSWVGFSIGSVS